MPRKSHSGRAKNQVRIIGGEWRGRKLSFPSVGGLRPTGDRIRETLFNWLGQNLAGLRALDLFAGSGSLGIEALSRGCDSVFFVDSNKQACDAISASLTLLNTDRGEVCHQTAEQFLGAAGNQSFDLVFLDPPFAHTAHSRIIHLIESSEILSPEAYIYVEAPVGESLALPSTWQEFRAKSSGDVHYQLLQTGL